MTEISADWPKTVDMEIEAAVSVPAAQVETRTYSSSPQRVVNGIRVPGSTNKTIETTYIGVVSPEGRTLSSKQVWSGLPFYGLRVALAKRSSNRIARRYNP